MFGAGYILQMLRDSGGDIEENDENSTNVDDKKSNNSAAADCQKLLESPPSTSSKIIISRQNDDDYNNDQNSSQQKDDDNIEILPPAIFDSAAAIAEENNEVPPPPPTSSEESPICLNFDFTTPPKLLLKETASFDRFAAKSSNNNFLKGCKWSPDGSCLLTNSEDRRLRVFTLPTEFYDQEFYKNKEVENEEGNYSLNQLSQISGGELVYDYCWYPLMNSNHPETCVFVQTSRDHPIQMCDALSSGRVCATYSPINHLDEVTNAHSLAFSPDGSRLYAGFNKCVRLFDTYRPGRQISTKPTWKKREASGQSGIISCIAVCPTMPNSYACGSYGKSVATYSDAFDGGPLTVFQSDDTGGITHCMYLPNGQYLYTGGRMDSKIICWDLRNPGRIFAQYDREAATNQRFYFDLDRSGRYLVSGSCDGEIKIWDTSTMSADDESAGAIKPEISFKAHESASNGVSFNPYLPIFASCSGQRVFPQPKVDDNNEDSEGEDEDSDSSNSNHDRSDNSVKLWLIHHHRQKIDQK